MYFYKYPEKIKNSIPQMRNTYKLDNGTTKTVTCKTVYRTTKIDWEHMRDHYNNDEKEEEKNAVSELMLYVGQSSISASSSVGTLCMVLISPSSFSHSAQVPLWGRYLWQPFPPEVARWRRRSHEQDFLWS